MYPIHFESGGFLRNRIIDFNCISQHSSDHMHQFVSGFLNLLPSPFLGLNYLSATGVALPMLFKDTRFWPVAFQVHRVVQVLGMAFLIAGLALGAKLNDDGGSKSIHKGVGIAVFALVWFQVSIDIILTPQTRVWPPPAHDRSDIRRKEQDDAARS
jgi:hypothetical protein